MNKNTLFPVPSRTLTGLGPPEPLAEDQPTDSERIVPETLRPWTVPDDAQDSDADDAVRIPLAPLVPFRRPPNEPRAPGVTRARSHLASTKPVQILLAAIALVGSCYFGWILGRPYISPLARVMAVEPGLPASPAVQIADPASSPTETPSSELPTAAQYAEPSETTLETRDEPAVTPNAEKTREVLGDRPPRRQGLSERGVKPATSLVADQARISAIARSVHLVDEGGDLDGGTDGG